MKRILPFSLVLIAVLILAACGGASYDQSRDLIPANGFGGSAPQEAPIQPEFYADAPSAGAPALDESGNSTGVSDGRTLRLYRLRNFGGGNSIMEHLRVQR